MEEKVIYSLTTPYRANMDIKGFSFGKGQKAACILGPVRGDEIQQMYICSKLVRVLKELEQGGHISANKSIMVIPVINSYSTNVSTKYFGADSVDINKCFPGSRNGAATYRMAHALTEEMTKYSYGIQFKGADRAGDYVPHVEMLDTGYQNASLANLFGLPYVMVRRPMPIDKKTINYNWQSELCAAFNVFTSRTIEIDDEGANQAIASVLRFLTRMGIIKYESHSGFISHVLSEDDLKTMYSSCGGLFISKVSAGDEVRYGMSLGTILDPYTGEVKEDILATTDGIIFFAHTKPLVSQYDTIYQMIRRLRQ